MSKIQGNLPPSSSLKLNASTPVALNLLKPLIGQTVSVQVIKVSSDHVSLNLGGQTLQAQTQLNLKPNDQLRVNVQEHQGQIRLQIQSNNNAVDLSKTHLRQLLPQQSPIQQTLNFLSQPQFLQQLPPIIQGQISAILDQLLKPNSHFNAKNIQQALINSGILLENKLSSKNNSFQSTQSDLKGQLIKLQQSLQPLAAQSKNPNITQALTLVNQSINKITLNQLHFLDNASILTNLPLQLPHQVGAITLEIRNKVDKEKSHWEVILQISVQEADDVTCKLSLKNDDQLDCYFHTEYKMLANQIQQAFPTLREMFNQAGLALNLLELSIVKPSFSANTQQVGLIDIKV
ncbi:flagellar hook-length control protein FliK [Thiomicrospira pelophila]|uniref:flagellar hook-length control protein FliK n=1 Tax=Thiomicrospira pelophila TaxID=934 RepID=UPI0004A771D3|nr:flagellar hook-length control protein FliK [Thiomicrospira pelophila]